MPKNPKATATAPRPGTPMPVKVQEDGDYRPVAISLEEKTLILNGPAAPGLAIDGLLGVLLVQVRQDCTYEQTESDQEQGMRWL